MPLHSLKCNFFKHLQKYTHSLVGKQLCYRQSLQVPPNRMGQTGPVHCVQSARCLNIFSVKRSSSTRGTGPLPICGTELNYPFLSLWQSLSLSPPNLILLRQLLTYFTYHLSIKQYQTISHNKCQKLLTFRRSLSLNLSVIICPFNMIARKNKQSVYLISPSVYLLALVAIFH